MGIIALDGATELAAKIDKYLVAWANKKSDGVKRETFIIDSAYPRFTTGDGKAIINETVRGKDLYIIADVGNHGCT